MSFNKLVDITNGLIPDYPESEAWADSPFNWIRSLPPNSKWSIARIALCGLFQHYGLTATTYRHQIKVNSMGLLHRIALMWETGAIKFENIRRDTNFDFVLCLALYPHTAYGWLIPKSEIWVDGAIRTGRPGITSQHKGADAWVHIDPANPHSWLKKYGGTIDEMIAVAQKNL
jgi:hypothetical protein